MARIRFKEYIRDGVWSGEAREFADEAMRDDDFPDATSWKQLRTYLEEVHAVEGAVMAGEIVWRQYEFVVLKNMGKG